MTAEKKAVLDRIKHLELAIAKGRLFLATGENGDWHGFRPLFIEKFKDGKMQPPHRGWVRKKFIPCKERALARNQDILDRMS